MTGLSRQTLVTIATKDNLKFPAANKPLPEKVLQFGTGVLLRGLPDYFIDKANKQGIFNGSIVVVKSTAQNSAADFEAQDNLYTVCIRGMEHGKKINEYSINTAISRVLSAAEEWQQVLACAADPEIRIVISNTTEVGISLKKDDIITGDKAPESFPGKLTAYLYRRYLQFKGAADAGMVVLPTELITGNGSRLKAICIELAGLNGLEESFITWLNENNDFCNTLVDRIVPGALQPHDARQTAEYLGYTDKLMIMSEVYRLWAIETEKPNTRELLSFAAADDGVIIAGNIEKFRDLKLRLLNGAHTFSCALALLNGFETVREAMQNAFFEKFVQDLMIQEIGTTLLSDTITEEEVQRFARSVLDRFRNPYIEHRWESISKQYTSKMLMRNVPTLLAYYKRFHKVPAQMALGFAAYLYFMRTEQTPAGSYLRHCYGKQIPVEDKQAGILHRHWQHSDTDTIVSSILSDESLWQADLSLLPGFCDAVADNIRKLKTQTKLTYNKVTT